MGIFWGRKKKEKLTLVFYLGSSSVGGVLFRRDESGIPGVLASILEPIALQQTLDINNFKLLAIKSLEVIVGKIYKKGYGKPDEIFCILSSPWHVSQTRIIKLEKNTPFTFTPKLALELTRKEIAIFEDEYKGKYSDARNSVRAIEFKNIKTMLNGYESSSPLGQKTRELEMTIFISISPGEVLQSIEETVRKYFHFKEIKYSSFNLASFAVVRDMYAHNEDFLLVGVDGEITDISMVKKNILRESVSFPLGYNFIIRTVASVSNTSLHEAESLVSLFLDGHATGAVAEKFGPTINKLRHEWLSKFQESVSNLSNDISVPSTIYLMVNKEMADFFGDTIKIEQFNQYTLTQSKFKVIFLSAEVFHGLVRFEENAVRDPFLVISLIHINRNMSSNVLSAVAPAEAGKV